MMTFAQYHTDCLRAYQLAPRKRFVVHVRHIGSPIIHLHGKFARMFARANQMQAWHLPNGLPCLSLEKYDQRWRRWLDVLERCHYTLITFADHVYNGPDAWKEANRGERLFIQPTIAA